MCECVNVAVCVHVQYSVKELSFFFFLFLQCAGNLIIGHTAVMSPANIYLVVCANRFSFFLSVSA